MKKLLVILVACLMPICLIAGSGDVNGDGNVNKSYVELIIDFIMGKASVAKEAVDFNNDSKVNAADIVEYVKGVNEDVNDLPEVLVATEEIGDWSEMRICRDGTFMLSKDVNNFLSEVNILCPDDTQGLIFSSIKINENGYPVDVAIENIRLLFTWADDKNFDVTIFDSDGNIYKYENLTLQETETYPARTRVPAVDQKPVIARVGGVLNVLSGLVSTGVGTTMVVSSGMLEAITAGAATPISGPGVVIGTLSIQDGIRDIYTGLLNATSNDYYETNNPLLSKARDEMIQRCVVPRIPDRYFAYLVDAPNTGWGNLGLGLVAGLLSNTRPAYTSNDLRRDIMENVYTGIYKDETYNSVTLRGYVNPYILSDPNGAFDTEYGILVYSNDNDHQHKGITNGNGGMIEYSFENLKHGTTYYYRTYYNDKTHSIGYLSEIKSFQTKKYNLPTITDFKVTKSQYSKGGFTNEGKTYDYSFNATVTISFPLADREDVEDWGYVYKDPNGKTKKISTSTANAEFVDNRYAYYRNQPISTACLYTYVKFIGMDEIIYGDPAEYDLIYAFKSCPDNNHPHWIDLGLPSGTKWRCCNEGASTPEADGGFFKFGQVKSAPSWEQIKELFGYTTSEWTTLNGVNGRRFTGSNGGTIFFPGDKYEYYWSSTHEDGMPYADSFWFDSDGAHTLLLDCNAGCTVRPVR